MVAAATAPAARRTGPHRPLWPRRGRSHGRAGNVTIEVRDARSISDMGTLLAGRLRTGEHEAPWAHERDSSLVAPQFTPLSERRPRKLRGRPPFGRTQIARE